MQWCPPVPYQHQSKASVGFDILLSQWFCNDPWCRIALTSLDGDVFQDKIRPLFMLPMGKVIIFLDELVRLWRHWLDRNWCYIFCIFFKWFWMIHHGILTCSGVYIDTSFRQWQRTKRAGTTSPGRIAASTGGLRAYRSLCSLSLKTATCWTRHNTFEKDYFSKCCIIFSSSTRWMDSTSVRIFAVVEALI